MRILVSDTSILIDLERGGLVESAFGCGFQIAVPDLLYDKELDDEFGQRLQALGLSIAELSAQELQNAQTLHEARRALSLADCSALLCAARPDHILLTGDRVLRREAEDHGIADVHGLLWLLDRIAEAERATPDQLHAGLTRISEGDRCRLPKPEVDERLRRWGPNGDGGNRGSECTFLKCPLTLPPPSAAARLSELETGVRVHFP